MFNLTMFREIELHLASFNLKYDSFPDAEQLAGKVLTQEITGYPGLFAAITDHFNKIMDRRSRAYWGAASYILDQDNKIMHNYIKDLEGDKLTY
jgi:alpha-D-ribose 1-methylphosphonate 5-triphosphate diphosphatase PhnM